mgnify:CR=1 FL=1
MRRRFTLFTVMFSVTLNRVLSPERKIRLRGKGIVAMNNPSVHGDEYATVQIEVPTNLTPEARRKLKEFEQECNGSRRSRGFGSGSAA